MYQRGYQRGLGQLFLSKEYGIPFPKSERVWNSIPKIGESMEFHNLDRRWYGILYSEKCYSTGPVVISVDFMTFRVLTSHKNPCSWRYENALKYNILSHVYEMEDRFIRNFRLEPIRPLCKFIFFFY